LLQACKDGLEEIIEEEGAVTLGFNLLLYNCDQIVHMEFDFKNSKVLVLGLVLKKIYFISQLSGFKSKSRG
jgi:hypothetical protein